MNNVEYITLEQHHSIDSLQRWGATSNVHPLLITNKIIVYKCSKFIMHNKCKITTSDTIQDLIIKSDLELEDALQLTKLQTQLELKL